MAASNITAEDAQEWLASLQQSGEGWYRQVALALKMNAHKALGMERRAFAAAIGHKMIDPREAIIELHHEGMSRNAIADVLGVDPTRTVARVLVEAGLIEPPARLLEDPRAGFRRARNGAPGSSDARASDSVDATAEEVDIEKERLAAEVEQLRATVEAQAKAKGESVKEQRKQIAEQMDRLREAAAKEARERAERAVAERVRLLEEARYRAQKEAERAQDEAERERERADREAGLVQEALDNAAEDIRRANDDAQEGAAKLRERVAKLTAELDRRVREERDREVGDENNPEYQRARKEAEARIAELKSEILKGAAVGLVQGIVGDLERATEGLGRLVADRALTVDLLAELDGPVQDFNNEYAVARATVNS